MTLVIQRAEHRDTQAIHAKLDELLRAQGQARNELAQLDDEEPEVIERHQKKLKRAAHPEAEGSDADTGSRGEIPSHDQTKKLESRWIAQPNAR